MNEDKKARRILFIFLFVFIAPCLCVYAIADTPTLQYPQYTGHVNDYAGVIDANTKADLEKLLTDFERASGAQIGVAVIRSLEDRPIEDYANGLYRAWGLGAQSGDNKDKGALLLISLDDRRTRLEVGYGLEGDMPDGLAGEIIRRMRPYLQQQNYSQGITLGVRTIVDTLCAKWEIKSLPNDGKDYTYRPEKNSENFSACIWPLLILIILIIVMVIRSRKGGKGGGGGPGSSDLWWLYPIIFNGGGGTFGGGSWGSSGGGGGSGWGGFGGGSSGGGGASDSW